MGSALVELIIHFYREDGIAVANEKAISMIGWNCLSKLLQGPLRRWVRGEIAVHDAPGPSSMRRKTYRVWNRAVITTKKSRDDGLNVVADKRPPALGAGSSRPSPLRLRRTAGPHRTRGNIDAELQRQLGGHASLPPGRILPRHPDDELADVLGQSRPA